MKSKKRILFYLSLIVILLFPLIFSKDKNYQASFYHWKNTYELKNSQEKLYIKVLDIFYSNKLELIKTSFKQTPSKDFIPVVYISNDAMKKSENQELLKKVKAALKNYEFKELQIDCDWTLSTKFKYFEFLKELKKDKDLILSATIRLHQIKYFSKTGVPPIDYGLLMYYNMSEIIKYETKNSILDNEVAKKYHYNFDTYPLKLKLALPLYSQAIQFRNKKALDIFEGVKIQDLQNEYFEKIDFNKYKVLKSTYFKGKYIYKNDILRFEDSKYEALKIALNDFFSLSKNSFKEVVFYTINYKNKYDLKSLLEGK